MPSNNNLVRDILPSGGRPRTMQQPPNKPARPSSRRVLPPPQKTKTRFSFSFGAKPNFTPLRFIILAVAGYAALLITINFFAKAEVDLYLKSENFEVKKTISAGVSGSEIRAEAVIFEEQKSAIFKTSESKDFTDKASGSIVVYNAYSSEPQTLVASTRFESADGKIYRITGQLVVPGAKIADGKIEPSSVEVKILAQEAGESYNIGLSDFTIPGFKGSPKYEKFYARSKTPMSGGFVGRAKVVTENDIRSSRQKIEEDLRGLLVSKMRSEIPDGFFAPEGDYKYEPETMSSVPAAGSRADEFNLTVKGRLKVFFIREDEVKRKILESYKNDPDFNGIDVANFNSLKILAQNQDFKALTLNLAVSGTVRAVWSVDGARLSRELVLASNSAERLKVFQSYPQINQAVVVYRPFWWRIFPERADKVVIITSY